MDIALRGLFATPVAAIEVPNAEERNVRLGQVILARRDQFPSIQSSNAGGWHLERDLPAWGGEDARSILALAQSAATRLTAGLDGRPVRPQWVMQAWANVNGPGDGNICHYHPGSFWSGTYYVADGGCAADPSLGGASEMLDPHGPGPAMYAPTLKFAGEDGQSVGSAETIPPRAGLLVLFLSWLYHQVRPYRGSALRISIAFNLGV